MDGTSLVSADQASGLVPIVMLAFKTVIATIVALAGLFISLFFGNKVINLLKSALNIY